MGLGFLNRCRQVRLLTGAPFSSFAGMAYWGACLASNQEVRVRSSLPAPDKAPFVYWPGCSPFKRVETDRNRQGAPINRRDRSTARTASFEGAHPGSNPGPASRPEQPAISAGVANGERKNRSASWEDALLITTLRLVRCRHERPKTPASFNGRTPDCGSGNERSIRSAGPTLRSQRECSLEAKAAVSKTATVGSSPASPAISLFHED
jgi:hypothetical protein